MSLVVGGDCIFVLMTVLWSGDVLISKLLVKVGTVVVGMTSRVWGVVSGGAVFSGKLTVRNCSEWGWSG